MKLETKNYMTPENKMTFGDFIMRFDHKFLRNIYNTEQVEKSDQIKSLESYYEIFRDYIMIFIGLIALSNNFNKHDFINLATKELVEEMFAGDNIRDIKNTINQTEIKNALLMTGGNVFKFSLKIYAYVYEQLLIFLPSEIDCEIDYEIDYEIEITTNNFFLHVHRLIKGKFHLHHSHTTGNIIGYAYDFCNMAFVDKCTSGITFVPHNFFWFDLFYFMKTYIASAWCSKELNIGGNNLTHANYGNISSEIKLIDSLKFYQRSLGELSSTLTPEEKTAVKNLAEKFLNEHYYFSTVWLYLSVCQKKQNFGNNCSG